MVLLAPRIGPIELIQRTHERPQAVREAIGKLPPIPAGGTLPSDPLHTALQAFQAQPPTHPRIPSRRDLEGLAQTFDCGMPPA